MQLFLSISATRMLAKLKIQELKSNQSYCDKIAAERRKKRNKSKGGKQFRCGGCGKNWKSWYGKTSKASITKHILNCNLLNENQLKFIFERHNLFKKLRQNLL